MKRDKLMEWVEKGSNEDILVIGSVLFLLGASVAGSYLFDYSVWLALAFTVLLTVSSLICFGASRRSFRKERLQRHMLATRIACAEALDAIQARGIRWAFVTQDPQHDLSCDMCRLQLISLTVNQRFQPVPGVQGRTHAVCMGTFCPGCGCSMKGIKNPVSGGLKDVLEYIEARPKEYSLKAPRDLDGMRCLMRMLENAIELSEAALPAGRRELAVLRERIAVEELKGSPAGYRVSVAPEPQEQARPPTQEVLRDEDDDRDQEERSVMVVRIIERGNRTIIG